MFTLSRMAGIFIYMMFGIVRISLTLAAIVLILQETLESWSSQTVSIHLMIGLTFLCFFHIVSTLVYQRLFIHRKRVPFFVGKRGNGFHHYFAMGVQRHTFDDHLPGIIQTAVQTLNSQRIIPPNTPYILFRFRWLRPIFHRDRLVLPGDPILPLERVVFTGKDAGLNYTQLVKTQFNGKKIELVIDITIALSNPAKFNGLERLRGYINDILEYQITSYFNEMERIQGVSIIHVLRYMQIYFAYILLEKNEVFGSSTMILTRKMTVEGEIPVSFL